MSQTVKKRQAFEVIAEIEQRWRQRHGAMMWSWSVQHLEFLVARWDLVVQNNQSRIQRLK